MPIYEYQCLQCGRNFELFQSVGADPGPCPYCQGTVRRIYSSIGVIFKGSGFYSTDNRKAPTDEGAPKEGAPKEAAGDRSSTPPKGAASEATKESKSDAKPS